MKAFIVDAYNKKGALRFGEMPEPDLRENDVLVEVHAAGVNLLDSKIRGGELQTHPAVPPAIHPGPRRGRDRGPGRTESARIQARR